MLDDSAIISVNFLPTYATSQKCLGGTEDWEMDAMTEEVDVAFVCKLSCVRSDKNAII
jgi:hypothetical protein